MADGLKFSRSRRIAFRGALALVVLYGLLLIPEGQAPTPKGAGQRAFLWKRDAFWSALENQMQVARELDPAQREVVVQTALARLQASLQAISVTNLPATAPAFDELETHLFVAAPLIVATTNVPPEFWEACAKLRREVKRQSEHWPTDARETRERLYRALYGRRAVVEEVFLQTWSPHAISRGEDEPSATPSATVRYVQLHSGDILVSRGGAATSALIARGNDFPGNFSHIALAHVNEQTRQVSVIEAHIESGVGVRPIEAYLEETKLRIMVLRLRSDLPALIADPMLPHKAASLALSNALARHIPYDFAMNHTDPEQQFCSEVAAAAYAPFGVRLWQNLSQLSTPGVTSWLAALGVRHFKTQEPSDLEYDPQLRVVAEWHDSNALFKDHVDNAVIDAMLEGAERGERLDYNCWLLPFARLAKAWSVVLNTSGSVGPVPEGMSAATALRVKRLKKYHAALAAQVSAAAREFKIERGYTPPYWELVRMAREAKRQEVATP